MSYQQAYENGILEPMHAASYYNYANQWATAVSYTHLDLYCFFIEYLPFVW